VKTGASKRVVAGLAAAGILLLLPAAGAPAGALEKRKAQYDDLVRSITAEIGGVDAALVHAVIRHESAYNQWAVSKAGAQGLMQLMPATAAAYGVKDVFDAEENIRGGVKFLKYLMRIYPEDDKVLAAYNAGQGAVKKYNGIPPYAETQTYIARVLATYNKPKKTKIYEFRDASGKTILTNDPRMVAQLGGINPK